MTADEIRAQRMALNLTQEELGSKLGVSGNTVARWERGEVVPESTKMLELAFEGLMAREILRTDPELVETMARVDARLKRLRPLRTRVRHTA
jgi:transcriptional regulator with XRE-family HTH domain